MGGPHDLHRMESSTSISCDVVSCDEKETLSEMTIYEPDQPFVDDPVSRFEEKLHNDGWRKAEFQNLRRVRLCGFTLCPEHSRIYMAQFIEPKEGTDAD